jgi:hypothetical protein
MKSTISKFGLYGMVCSFMLFLTGLFFGMGLDFGTQEVIGYLTIVLSLSFVYFGIRHYRDNVNQGTLKFKKAMAVGLLISAVTALGIAIADFIYTTMINPDFFEEYKEVMRAEGYKGEIPDYGSGFLALVMFITVMIIGLVISVLSGLILKKE